LTLPRPLAESDLFWHWRSVPTYDPYFTAALYATNDRSSGQADSMVLWDIGDQIERWVSHPWNYPLELAGLDWRADGQAAVVIGPPPSSSNQARPELLLLDKDGQVQTLTNLQAMPDLVSQDFYLIHQPRWSPDGRHIAFIFDRTGTRSESGGQLFILDTTTHKLTDFCIDTVSLEFGYYWSPTSTKIAYTDAVSHVLTILDLQSRNLLNVRVPALLRGWLDLGSE
jgi:hypothetical protein